MITSLIELGLDDLMPLIRGEGMEEILSRECPYARNDGFW